MIAERLPEPIEKGLPGPGLMAHVAVSKYADHLPLYRQEGIFKRFGVELSRSTMCDWMAVPTGTVWRTKTCRQVVAGRPLRRYSAIARPTPSVRGKYPRPPRLAARDPQGGRAPVEVLEVECAHLADPQAEVDLTEGHGVVAAARRGRPVEAGQEHGGAVRRSSCAGGDPVASRGYEGRRPPAPVRSRRGAGGTAGGFAGSWPRPGPSRGDSGRRIPR